ncbi:hypothetical protein D3C76_1466980 [compost metagenome]
MTVDDGIRQDVLHVLACFIKGNGFDPHIKTQVVGTPEPLPNAPRAGVVRGRGQHTVAVELAVHLTEVGSAQLDVLVRVQHLPWRRQWDIELARCFPGGCRHQLHQASGTDTGPGVLHEGTLLASDSEHPA